MSTNNQQPKQENDLNEVKKDFQDFMIGLSNVDISTEQVFDAPKDNLSDNSDITKEKNNQSSVEEETFDEPWEYLKSYPYLSAAIKEGNDQNLKEPSTTIKNASHTENSKSDKDDVIKEGNNQNLKEPSTTIKNASHTENPKPNKDATIKEGNNQNLKESSTTIKNASHTENPKSDKKTAFN